MLDELIGELAGRPRHGLHHQPRFRRDRKPGHPRQPAARGEDPARRGGRGAALALPAARSSRCPKAGTPPSWSPLSSRSRHAETSAAPPTRAGRPLGRRGLEDLLASRAAPKVLLPRPRGPASAAVYRYRGEPRPSRGFSASRFRQFAVLSAFGLGLVLAGILVKSYLARSWQYARSIEDALSIAAGYRRSPRPRRRQPPLCSRLRMTGLLSFGRPRSRGPAWPFQRRRRRKVEGLSFFGDLAAPLPSRSFQTVPVWFKEGVDGRKVWRWSLLRQERTRNIN